LQHCVVGTGDRAVVEARIRQLHLTYIIIRHDKQKAKAVTVTPRTAKISTMND